MAGFCPFDARFLEDPGSPFGGQIAFQLGRSTGLPGCLNLVPGESPFAVAPCECDSLQGALDRMRSECSSARYVYRGQTSRRRCAAEGDVPLLRQAVGIDVPVRFEVESLLPTFARQLCGSGARPVVDWRRWLPISKLDHAAAPLRAAAASSDPKLASLAAAACRHTFDHVVLTATLNGTFSGLPMLGDVRTAFFGGGPDEALRANMPESLAKLICLGQHYEYRTCMVDVTTSLEVAAWFAGHQWSGERHPPDGTGVIYRFDPERLVGQLNHLLFGDRADRAKLAALGSFGHVDLHGIDDKLCPRVRAQSGGSLFGLESVVVMAIASTCGAMELFTFPHAASNGAESGLGVADICPADDPFVLHFGDQFRSASDLLTWSEIEPLLRSTGADRGQLAIYQLHWMNYMAGIVEHLKRSS